MTRILTPKRNIDILRDCRMVKEKEKRPYVITFVGINGVGKSTSLAKVVSWLKQNGQKVCPPPFSAIFLIDWDF